MSHVPFLVLLTLLLGVPGLLLVITQLLGMRRNATVALLQDAAPFVLARSWVATVVAAAFGYFWIAAIGLCLGVYHLVLLRRSARPDEVPAG